MSEAPTTRGDAALLETWELLDEGRAEEALSTWSRAAQELPADDFDLLWARAELLLREWRVEEARTAFEALLAQERSPALLESLALCLELGEDFDGAELLYQEAARLDPGGVPVPPRLSDEEFDRVVEAAVAELPESHQRALKDCRVVTEPMPFPDLVEGGDPWATPPDLLGLFVGATIHDLAEDASAQLPPTIYLFQRNLERSTLDRGQLREEIRITLFHELGHLLGLNDEEVEARGLG